MSVPKPDPALTDSGAAFLDVDPENFDIKCRQQPKQMRYWCRQLALARKKSTEAKNNIRLVLAEKRNEIRQMAKNQGEKAPNMDAIDDAVEISVEYRNAKQAHVEAELTEGLIEANVKALASQDYQLTNDGKLLELGYWTNPRIDPATRDRYLKQKQQYMDVESARAAAQDSKPPAKKPVRK